MNSKTNDVLSRIRHMVEADPGMERTAKLKNPAVGKAKVMGPDTDETVADDLDAAHPHPDDGVHKHMESIIARLRRSLAEQEDKAGKQRTAGLKMHAPSEVESESESESDSIADDLQGKHKGVSVGKATKTMEAKDEKAKCCQCESMCEMDEMYEGEDGPMCGECWSGMSEAILATVPSKSNPEKSYEIHMGKDGNVYCTCPAWKYQKGVSPKDRTCKHIKALYGAMASQAKLKLPKDMPAESVLPIDGDESLVIESSIREIAALISEGGEKFKKLKKQLAARPDVTSPAGLAAWIGRKKYGAEKFQKMALKGRKKHQKK